MGPRSSSASPAGRSFGDAVRQGERSAPPAATDEPVDEWLWILGHDNAPAPTALADLLGAVEIAPSVVVAGPKLVADDDPSLIRAFGESMTRFGRSIVLVQDELDQGQHDRNTDVLGVTAGGMLVRRSVWNELGGFDPALPDVDAALDFSVRVRLAGHRVALVPEARVTSAGPIEEFGRKRVSEARRVRMHRQAQLHRRMTYAPVALVWLHWLTLVPFAVGRALGHLVAKHPAAVVPELSAAFAVAFGGGTGRARKNLARTKQLGWAAVEPLRVSWRRVYEHRTTSRDVELARVEGRPDRPGVVPRRRRDLGGPGRRGAQRRDALPAARLAGPDRRGTPAALRDPRSALAERRVRLPLARHRLHGPVRPLHRGARRARLDRLLVAVHRGRARHARRLPAVRPRSLVRGPQGHDPHLGAGHRRVALRHRSVARRRGDDRAPRCRDRAPGPAVAVRRRARGAPLVGLGLGCVAAVRRGRRLGSVAAAGPADRLARGAAGRLAPGPPSRVHPGADRGAVPAADPGAGSTRQPARRVRRPRGAVRDPGTVRPAAGHRAAPARLERLAARDLRADARRRGPCRS
ncbi:hypothetical protein Q9Q99_05800 [Curtobacterium flaccumfaciens]|nr:hypothetical protein Q9Q99_05800 [Curtobacterium flaccumfaciens]